MNYFLINLCRTYPSFFQALNFLRDLIILIQFLIFVLYSLKIKKIYYFIYLVILLFIGFGVIFLINKQFPTLRPFYFCLPYFVRFDSLPSGHTFSSFIITLVILKNNLNLGIVSFLLTLIIAILSFFSLRHWPLDIFVSFLLGYFIFFLGEKILHFFNRTNINQRKDK
jgi:membrane-associated phospholipid phosphatase